MTHHPHVHMIVPGGGLSPDGSSWIASRSDYFLPVEVLSALFRGLMLSSLRKAHKAGKLQFFGDHAGLADRKAFAAFLRPWATADWVVYAKEPFGGPQEVLRYLSRYTHRVAISNRRLIAADENGVTFRYKDYRIDGPGRYTTMTLDTHEFIRRFLMHVLPKGLHRIRHYGFLANGTRADNIAKVRELLSVAPTKSPRARRPRQPIRPARCRVPAAVVVCSSSRSSSPVASPSTGLARPRASSGSTHHDAQRTGPKQHRPCVLPASGQPHRRLPKCWKSATDHACDAVGQHTPVGLPSPQSLLLSSTIDATGRCSQDLPGRHQASNRHKARCGRLLSLPRLRALQVCRRRPTLGVAAVPHGRHPQTFTKAVMAHRRPCAR
jgi:hypothetical protein